MVPLDRRGLLLYCLIFILSFCYCSSFLLLFYLYFFRRLSRQAPDNTMGFTLKHSHRGRCFSGGGIIVRGTPYTIPFHLPPPSISISTLRLWCLKLPFRLRSLYFDSEAPTLTPKPLL